MVNACYNFNIVNEKKTVIKIGVYSVFVTHTWTKNFKGNVKYI